MSTVGLRELRQKASEILREVEAGETATVTVSGRPIAQIVPLRAERWTTWERMSVIYDSPTDPEWNGRDLGVPDLSDTWAR